MKHKLRVVLAGLVSLAMFASGLLVFAAPAAAIDADSEIVIFENVDIGGYLEASPGNSPLAVDRGEGAYNRFAMWEVINLDAGAVAFKNVGTDRYMKTRSNAMAPPPYEVLAARANAGLHASYQWSVDPVIDTDFVTLKNARANRYLDADETQTSLGRVDLHPKKARGTTWEIIPVPTASLVPEYNGNTFFYFSNTYSGEIDFGALFEDPLGGDMTFAMDGPIERAFNPTAMIDPDTGVFSIDLQASAQPSSIVYDVIISATNDVGTTEVYIGTISAIGD